MTNKRQSTESTFIYAGNSTLASLAISRVQPKKTHQFLKGLSFSLQNLRNPFPQTLPLKFPKKRIVKGCKSHMLEESMYNDCLKIVNSFVNPVSDRLKFAINIISRYKRKMESKSRIKQIKFLKTTIFIKMYIVQQIFLIMLQNSHSSSVNQSLEKGSKRIFNHLVLKQSIRDPILIGEINADSLSRGKRQFQNESRRKNHGEGAQSSLDWKINKSDEKIKFNNKCKAVPQLNLTHLNLTKNTSQTQRNTERITQRNTQRIPEKIKKEAPMTSRKDQKPKTYTEMYNSRKIGIK